MDDRSRCDVCAKAFDVKFRYQVREEKGGYVYVCSTLCQRNLLAQGSCCSVCDKKFELEFPYQVVVRDGGRHYFCTQECRAATPKLPARERPTEARRIAVFNHKGGTGKTTTAVNLAAGLAEKGKRVLLIDADGQGNVGASLGIRGEKTLYHVLVQGASVEEAAIPVRNNLDVLTSNEMLASAELYLAQRPNRHRVLRERLGSAVKGYDVVVLDCAPALSLLNQNALVYADGVVIPVGCDYLSLIGVKQVLKTLKNVRTLLQHEPRILGVIPTFYDVRNRISRDAVATLEKHFGERCLTPIRVNTKLREAPSMRQTIFEYAPESHGAIDYRRAVEEILLAGKAPEASAVLAKPAVVASPVTKPVVEAASVVPKRRSFSRPKPFVAKETSSPSTPPSPRPTPSLRTRRALV
ncbi:MAG: chromosome partitioning protein [Polyangiales bacterium]|jgi:chromosome partitioning protein